MAKCNIPQIDDLLDAAGGPITAGSDKRAIGGVQDLLRGHGFRKMPGLNAASYGTFGKATRAALLAFCKQHCPSAITLGQVNEVSRATLEALLVVEATNPVASQVYVARRLDLEFTGLNRLACLVAIGEGQGAFGVLCLNTDKAGLSAGMIQWAQYPQRLNKLLKAIPKARLTAAFGSVAMADSVLQHTALTGDNPKVRGGVRQSDGKPADSAMDFTLNDWPAKFRRLCVDLEVQKIQVTHAAEVFKSQKKDFDDLVPEPKSERLVAYLLDVVNQFGSPAPGFLKKAVDEGNLPASVKERGMELIERVTRIANERLRAIGESVKDGKQKWTESMILKVQKSRTDRGAFFKTWSGLADTAF